jgi:AAA ATPase domain
VRLNCVHIANFRSIKSIRINFDPRCRVLVGINESGKSNVLKALALLDPDRKITPGDLRDFPDEEDPSQNAYVRFVFTLDKDERIASYEKALSEVLWEDPSVPVLTAGAKNFTLAQFFDTRTEGLYIIDVRSQSRSATVWRLSEEFKLAGSWKKPSAACPAAQQVVTPEGKTVLLKSFKLLQADLVQNIPDECLTNAEPEDVHALVRRQFSSLISGNLPGCLYWTYSDSHLLPAQINLDAFAANPDMCEPLKHMFALADLDDIGSEISTAKSRPNGIRNLLNRVASRATKHMKSVWKEYRGINIELSPNGPNIDASIRDEHNLYDFPAVATGSNASSLF